MVDKKKKPKAKHNIKVSNKNKNSIKITINQPTKIKTKSGGHKKSIVYIPSLQYVTQYIPQSQQPNVLFIDRPQNDLNSILQKTETKTNIPLTAETNSNLGDLINIKKTSTSTTNNIPAKKLYDEEDEDIYTNGPNIKLKMPSTTQSSTTKAPPSLLNELTNKTKTIKSKIEEAEAQQNQNELNLAKEKEESIKKVKESDKYKKEIRDIENATANSLSENKFFDSKIKTIKDQKENIKIKMCEEKNNEYYLEFGSKLQKGKGEQYATFYDKLCQELYHSKLKKK